MFISISIYYNNLYSSNDTMSRVIVFPYYNQIYFKNTPTISLHYTYTYTTKQTFYTINSTQKKHNSNFNIQTSLSYLSLFRFATRKIFLTLPVSLSFLNYAYIFHRIISCGLERLTFCRFYSNYNSIEYSKTV